MLDPSNYVVAFEAVMSAIDNGTITEDRINQFESISYNRIISLILKQKRQDLSQRLSFACTPAECHRIADYIGNVRVFLIRFGTLYQDSAEQ